MAETAIVRAPERLAEFLVHFGLDRNEVNIVAADTALMVDPDAVMRSRPVPCDIGPDDFYKVGYKDKEDVVAMASSGIFELLNQAQADFQIVKVTLPRDQRDRGDVAYEATVVVTNADGVPRKGAGRYDWIVPDQLDAIKAEAAEADPPRPWEKRWKEKLKHRDGEAQTKAIERAARKVLRVRAMRRSQANRPWWLVRSELNVNSRNPAVVQGIIAARTGMAGALYGQPVRGFPQASATLGTGAITVEDGPPPDEDDPFGPDNGDPEPPDEEPEGEPMVDPEGFGGPARCDGGCGTLVGEDEAELTHMAGFKDKTYCAGCLVREVKAVKAAARAAETGEAAPAPTPADGEPRGPNGRLLCQECGEKELTSKGQDWVLEQREAGRDPKVRCYQCGQKRGAA